MTQVAKTVSDPPNEQASWGLTIHRAFEDRLKSKKPFNDELKEYEPIASTLERKAAGGVLEAEQKLALDANFKPVSWFAKDTWVRGIIDVSIVKKDVAFVGDLKTGKPTPDSAQLKLTAAMMLHHKPWLTKVVNTFIWLKTGNTTTEVITRDDIPTVWQEFSPRVQRLDIAHAENKFPPRPSGLCRKHCPCKGCEHNGFYTGAGKQETNQE